MSIMWIEVTCWRRPAGWTQSSCASPPRTPGPQWQSRPGAPRKWGSGSSRGWRPWPPWPASGLWPSCAPGTDPCWNTNLEGIHWCTFKRLSLQRPIIKKKRAKTAQQQGTKCTTMIVIIIFNLQKISIFPRIATWLCPCPYQISL